MASTTSGGFRVEDDRRLEIANGSNWSGELAGKIEHHSASMYHQFTTSWIARNASGSNVFTVDSSGNGQQMPMFQHTQTYSFKRRC